MYIRYVTVADVLNLICNVAKRHQFRFIFILNLLPAQRQAEFRDHQKINCDNNQRISHNTDPYVHYNVEFENDQLIEYDVKKTTTTPRIEV